MTHNDLPAALQCYAAGHTSFPDNERLKVFESTARICLGLDDGAFDLDAEPDNPTHTEAVFLAVSADRISSALGTNDLLRECNSIIKDIHSE